MVCVTPKLREFELLMLKKSRSYLQYVPTLYGSSECVTAAANCLLAKAKLTLSPKKECSETTLRLYAKALRTLQTALMDEENCTGPDVLCATQLLSLHEVSEANHLRLSQ